MTATNRLLNVFNKPEEGVVAASPVLGKVMDVFSGERKENFLNGLNLGKESGLEGVFWTPAHRRQCTGEEKHLCGPGRSWKFPGALGYTARAHLSARDKCAEKQAGPGKLFSTQACKVRVGVNGQ